MTAAMDVAGVAAWMWTSRAVVDSGEPLVDSLDADGRDGSERAGDDWEG